MALSRRDDEDMIVCKIDNIRIADHPRCVVCRILIGPGHYEPRGYKIGDKWVCADCRKRLRTQTDRREH